MGYGITILGCTVRFQYIIYRELRKASHIYSRMAFCMVSQELLKAILQKKRMLLNFNSDIICSDNNRICNGVALRVALLHILLLTRRVTLSTVRVTLFPLLLFKNRI